MKLQPLQPARTTSNNPMGSVQSKGWKFCFIALSLRCHVCADPPIFDGKVNDMIFPSGCPRHDGWRQAEPFHLSPGLIPSRPSSISFCRFGRTTSARFLVSRSWNLWGCPEGRWQ